MSAPLIDSSYRIEKDLPQGAIKSISEVTIHQNEPWLVDSDGYLYQKQHVTKGLYPIYDWSFDPKTGAPGTAFTQATQIDFEYKNSPTYYLVDNDAIYLEINVSNNSVANTVTPTFAELLFDEIKGFEWMMNGVTFYQVPSFQILLEPALELPDTQYISFASLANHDNTLAYNASAKASIAGNIYLKFYLIYF
jgi:hypothetical protein